MLPHTFNEREFSVCTALQHSQSLRYGTPMLSGLAGHHSGYFAPISCFARSNGGDLFVVRGPRFNRLNAFMRIRRSDPHAFCRRQERGFVDQPHLISIVAAVGPAALCSASGGPILQRHEVEPAGFPRGPRSCLRQSAGRPPAEDAGAA